MDRVKKYQATEHQEQAALITWANSSLRRYPQLKWLFAVPNGGQRHLAVAVKLKAEGVKPGVLDLILPVPNGKYVGIVIEMKVKPNKVTEDQQKWLDMFAENGWKTCVCYDWEAAKSELEDYLK